MYGSYNRNYISFITGTIGCWQHWLICSNCTVSYCCRGEMVQPRQTTVDDRSIVTAVKTKISDCAGTILVTGISTTYCPTVSCLTAIPYLYIPVQYTIYIPVYCIVPVQYLHFKYPIKCECINSTNLPAPYSPYIFMCILCMYNMAQYGSYFSFILS